MLSQTYPTVTRNLEDTADITKEWTRYREFDMNSLYISDQHTDATEDKLQFYVSDPKPNGTFLGQRKTATKHTKTCVVEDSEGNPTLKNQILHITWSKPVGISDEDLHDIIEEAKAILDNLVLRVAHHITGQF